MTNKHLYLKSIIVILLLFSGNISRLVNSPAFASECECAEDSDEIALLYEESGTLHDIYGREVSFKEIPQRAVSLVPAVTEMIEAVNPEYRLAGVTSFDTNLNTAGKAAVVGGFYRPDVNRIKALKPDIIFAASLQSEVHNEFKDSRTHVIILDAHNAECVYRNIEIIGRIFHNERNAKYTIESIKSKIANTQKKLATVPPEKRLRAMRIMNFDGSTLWTAGDDSFQAEAVRLAGGIPPDTGRKGQIVSMTLDEWIKFDPQVIYTCGDSEKIWNTLSGAKDWNMVKAVKNKRYLVFPCNLTCRPSVNYGAFIEYLSASLYGDIFFASKPVNKDHSFKEKKININLPYIKNASVLYGTIDDFEQKTLVVKFKNAQDVLSTLTGLEKASVIGNHYLSPPRWQDGHTVSLDGLKKKICNAVNEDPATSSFLITGADMDNLAVTVKEYKAFKVYALVTAGVMGNAQRQSADEGLYYPHGTINMILLTNTRLSSGAMARAIIAATEAKTAALQDMDIRSTYTPLANQATGTGTDNIIVASGEGQAVDSTGGHTKMGELIAKAAYEGVIKAVRMQNKVKASRSVYLRLEERKITAYKLASSAVKQLSADKIRELASRIESALSDKEVREFLETAFTASDASDRGLISESSLFRKWSLDIARKISGKKITRLIKLNMDMDENSPLNIALSAIVTGAVNSPFPVSE